MVINEFLDLAAMLVPERTAIAFEGKRYSYTQLKERVNRLADSLSRLGLEKGDRAAILEVNCPEYVEACFATLKAGGIFVPLNFRIRQDELVYLVNKAEPKTLFVGSRYADMVSSVRPQLPSVKHFIILGEKQQTLAAMRQLRGSLEKISEEFPLLWNNASGIVELRQLEKDIASCLAPNGEMLDSASPRLAAVRRQLRQVRQQLLDRLKVTMESPRGCTVVQEPIITRAGRQVCYSRQD